MLNVLSLLALVIPLLIAVYTANYCRWAWRRRLRRGALGLAFLAVSTMVLPVFIMWVHS